MAMHRFPTHRIIHIDEYAAADYQKDIASHDIIDVPSRNILPANIIHRANVPRIARR
jgi:hypothetical protein